MLQNMNPNNHDNNAFSKAIIGPYITLILWTFHEVWYSNRCLLNETAVWRCLFYYKDDAYPIEKSKRFKTIGKPPRWAERRVFDYTSKKKYTQIEDTVWAWTITHYKVMQAACWKMAHSLRFTRLFTTRFILAAA